MVKDVARLHTSNLRDRDAALRNSRGTSDIVEAQEKGFRLAKEWAKGDATATLPLSTLIFEITDASNSTWKKADLLLHPPQATEQTQSLRILYDYVELCTPTSRSCIRLLRTNHTFRGSLKRDNPSGLACVLPAPMGILAHGISILPPSTSRKPFIHLPSELLHMIFRNVARDTSQCSWRAALVFFALVCRTWRPALDHLFENFGRYNAGRKPPDVLRLGRTLELNSELGRRIKAFDPSHFRVVPTSESSYLDIAKAIVTILQSASMVTDLCIVDTHRSLAEGFVRALCSSSDVRTFWINRSGFSTTDPDYIYTLSVSDILQCMSHWPRIHQLWIYGFSSTPTIEDLPEVTCSIKSVSLHRGSLKLPQLRSLTTSTKSALQIASLQYISGLTNRDLYTWLTEVGPTLTHLTIQFSTISRQSDDEEYAVDVVLPTMTTLIHLDLEGDITSELVLMRYSPDQSSQSSKSWRRWGSLRIDNAPGMSAHGFVRALKTTEWSQISVANLVLREENREVKEEAKKIARERKICLMMM